MNMGGKIDDGGPAFPVPVNETKQVEEGFETYPSGMTLRDWFAGQAMAALSNSSALNDQKVAEYSYELADAMLAERNRV